MPQVSFRNGHLEGSTPVSGDVGMYFLSRGIRLEVPDKASISRLEVLKTENWSGTVYKCSLKCTADETGTLDVNGHLMKTYEYFVLHGVDPMSALEIMLNR